MYLTIEPISLDVYPLMSAEEYFMGNTTRRHRNYHFKEGFSSLSHYLLYPSEDGNITLFVLDSQYVACYINLTWMQYQFF